MDEPDPVGDLQLGGAGTRRRGEDRADVHPSAADVVVAGPGAQQLTLAAGQVEDGHTRAQVQDAAQDNQPLGRERVQDAMAALTDDKTARKIHFESPIRRFRRGW